MIFRADSKVKTKKIKMSDKQLIQDIKEGNVKVFENLFRLLYPALCGYALKILKDTDQAEEIVQDMFYTLWKKRKTIVVNVSLKSYLYKSVYNKSLHFIKHQAVVNKYAGLYKQKTAAYYKPDDAMQTGEMYEVYKKTLRELPDRCREVFQLSRKFGLKYYEIAEKLSISVKTVEANMGKALKAFKHSLAEYQNI